MAAYYRVAFNATEGHSFKPPLNNQPGRRPLTEDRLAQEEVKWRRAIRAEEVGSAKACAVERATTAQVREAAEPATEPASAAAVTERDMGNALRLLKGDPPSYRS